MASAYTPLGVQLMVTGEKAGLWGGYTTTNLEILEQIYENLDYGDIYNFDNPDRPFLFTFITEHSPQEGHCVLINMKNQKVETMRHTSDFRLAAEEEC